jgi:hypothetical protein
MAMKRLLENFQKYINEEELEEATRASKEGVVLPSVLEKLEKYVVSDNEEPTHFFQFSDINKLGVNPRSKYNTPMGIYAYPLIRTLLDQYKSGSIPFASQRKYVIIFKTNPRSNVLFAREGEDSIGDTRTENMVEFLYSREAAMLTGNPEFYKEASAYIHGDIFWYYNDPLGRYSPGPEKDEIHETLDLVVDEFLNWSTNVLPSNVSDTLWADLMDEYEDVIGSASLGSTRSEGIRSLLWNIVEYIIKDWGSFPFGQIREYEEIIEEFKALVIRKKTRRLKQRNNYFSSPDSRNKMEDYKWQVSRLEDTIFTVNHYAVLKAWLKTYYRKMEKGEATTLGRYSVEVQMTGAKNPKDIEMLNLEEFANLNKQIRKSSWEKSIPGLNNPPSVSAIQMTDSWKVMTTKSKNKTNLGMLWYGSMLLAGNLSRSMDQKHGHGMKVWRTILQKLWGIDGVVDMGSVGPDASGAVPIIHEAEPTQAVFFSKSAIQHVTTLKNTETPDALERRKKGKQKLLTRLIVPLVEQEWNQLYADHIADMAPMDDATLDTFGISRLTYEIFYQAEDRLGEDAYDQFFWKKVLNTSLDELHNAKIDPTTLQPIEQHVLFFRLRLSKFLFNKWLKMVDIEINKKVKKVYMLSGEISTPWNTTADLTNIFKHIKEKVRTNARGTQWIQPHVEISDFNKADLLRYINKTVNFHNLVNKIYLSAAAINNRDNPDWIGDWNQGERRHQAANEMTKLLARRPYTELGL